MTHKPFARPTTPGAQAELDEGIRLHDDALARKVSVEKGLIQRESRRTGRSVAEIAADRVRYFAMLEAADGRVSSHNSEVIGGQRVEVSYGAISGALAAVYELPVPVISPELG